MLICTCFLPGRRIWHRANMIYRKAGMGREVGGVCACTNPPSYTTEIILSPEIIWWRGNRWHLMFINNVSIPFQVGSVVTGCQYYFGITNLISGLCFHCFFIKKGMGKWKRYQRARLLSKESSGRYKRQSLKSWTLQRPLLINGMVMIPLVPSLSYWISEKGYLSLM